MRPLLSIAVLASIALAAPAAAQTVNGRVVEHDGQHPVSRVTVRLLSGRDVRAQAQTGDDGAFSLVVPGPGTYRVSAARLGFAPVLSAAMRIDPLDSVNLTFRLDPRVFTLDTLEATTTRRQAPARLAGFYNRASRNRQGHFILRETIERAGASRTTDLLRRIPGLQFRPSPKGYMVRGRGGCEPQVYVDGMDVNLFGNSNTVDELVRPEDLEGIEVYASSAIPVEFERSTKGMECGAVMLWTRMTL